ncbi:PRD domain-containing protein [Erwinia mallotivora]
MRALLSYNCSNNIGQLKSDIRFSCARAWLEYCSGEREQVEVYSRMLPEYISNALYINIDHRQIWSDISSINNKSIVFSEDDFRVPEESDHVSNIFDMLDLRTSVLKSLGLAEHEVERAMENDIAEYLHVQAIKECDDYHSQKLHRQVPEKTLRLTEELVRYAEIKLQCPLNFRLHYSLANHIGEIVERVYRNKFITHPQLNNIRKSQNKFFDLALDWLHIIERVMEVTLPVDEAGFLAMFLIFSEQNIDYQNNNVQVFVVAHGENTASALTDTANQLSGMDYAIAFNAPLEQKPQQVLDRIVNYIRSKKKKTDIMMLVDMGSLTTFAANIERQRDIKVASLQLISTLHIVEAIQSAMNGNPLQVVYEDVQKVNQFLYIPVDNTDYQPFSYKENRGSRKLAIIILCTTGEDSFRAIENLLIRALSYRKNIIKFSLLNTDDEDNIARNITAISEKYLIVSVISHFPIKSEIPVFNLADILHHNGISEI